MNFPNGLKWTEMEIFLKNQLKNTRRTRKEQHTNESIDEQTSETQNIPANKTCENKSEKSKEAARNVEKTDRLIKKKNAKEVDKSENFIRTQTVEEILSNAEARDGQIIRLNKTSKSGNQEVVVVEESTTHAVTEDSVLNSTTETTTSNKDSDEEPDDTRNNCPENITPTEIIVNDSDEDEDEDEDKGKGKGEVEVEEADEEADVESANLVIAVHVPLISVEAERVASRTSVQYYQYIEFDSRVVVLKLELVAGPSEGKEAEEDASEADERADVTVPYGS